MKYDFTTVIDRHGWDAKAVDALGTVPGITPQPPQPGFDVIPMWIADMSFPTVPTIPEAIVQRTQHGIYGYYVPTDEFYDSIIRWQSRRNGVEGLKKEHIGYENGVLGGIVSALKAVASRGDRVLVHSPTYIGFTKVLKNNGYAIVHSELVQDAEGVWRMDYADMERKIVENDIHTAILCSPHNPTGRVWTREELETVMELFRKHQVYVISDEIWSDLTLHDHQHIPTQSVSEDARSRTVALYAPSKTFNLAGLLGSYHIIYDPWLRHRVRQEAAVTHYNEMNVLSMHALIGAYKEEGHEWLDELKMILSTNVDYACRYIEQNFSDVKVTRPEGTYVLFLDCTQWCEKHGKTLDELLRASWDVGVAWQDGRAFHGPCHIRMNLALPRARVEEAFARLSKYVFVD